MPTILTTEQIRVLNDARTILNDFRPVGHTWEAGRAFEAAEAAESGIFNLLNVMNACNIQQISEPLMHNKEDGDQTRLLGRADAISVESDEDGFELHIGTDTGVYAVNVHAVAEELYRETYRDIGGWLFEAHQARVSRPITVDGAGYDTSDPKHPDWHSIHADLYDSREGK